MKNDARIRFWLIMTAAVLCLGMASAPAESPEEKRVGFAFGMKGAPDASWVAFALENWTSEGAERALKLFGKYSGSYDRTTISLTLEYPEIVEGPDPSVIAYLTKELRGAHEIYDVYVMGRVRAGRKSDYDRPKEGPYSVAPWRQEESVKTQKRGLQFSADGRYLRYLEKPSADSEEEAYRHLTVEGNSLEESAMQEVEWHPVKAPAQLPPFITTPQPRIHEETAPVWSPDSFGLYVHDEQGVWKAAFDRAPRKAVWSLVLPMSDVRAFQLSPDGRRMLFEIGKQMRQAVLVDLEAAYSAPTAVGKGWCARFSPDGKQVAYLNRQGAYAADVENPKPRRIGGKIQPKIDTSSRLQWSHDSALLYAHDAEGVWSASAEPDGNGWTKVVEIAGVHTFRVAYRVFRPAMLILGEPIPEPKISHRLIVEADVETDGGASDHAIRNGSRLKERQFIYFDLTGEESEPYYGFKGWGNGSDGNESSRWFYHADLKGLHLDRWGTDCGVIYKLEYNE